MGVGKKGSSVCVRRGNGEWGLVNNSMEHDADLAMGLPILSRFSHTLNLQPTLVAAAAA